MKSAFQTRNCLSSLSEAGGENVLFRHQELATTEGFSYCSGSACNNVINPRFSHGGGYSSFADE